MMYLVRVLLIFLYIQPTSEAPIDTVRVGAQINDVVKNIGNLVIPSDSVIKQGPVVFLHKDLIVQDGVVIMFDAGVTGLSNLTFQVWRQVKSTPTISSFKLIGQSPEVVVTKKGILSVRLKPSDYIKCKTGDMLGFMSHGEESAVTAQFYPFLETDLRSSSMSDEKNGRPKISEIYEFDDLPFPYQFSIGLTYIPEGEPIPDFGGDTEGAGSEIIVEIEEEEETEYTTATPRVDTTTTSIEIPSEKPINEDGNSFFELLDNDVILGILIWLVIVSCILIAVALILYLVKRKRAANQRQTKSRSKFGGRTFQRRPSMDDL